MNIFKTKKTKNINGNSMRSIGVKDEIYRELVSLQGAIQNKAGKRISFSDLIYALVKTSDRKSLEKQILK